MYGRMLGDSFDISCIYHQNTPGEMQCNREIIANVQFMAYCDLNSIETRGKYSELYNDFGWVESKSGMTGGG